jgi:thiosulfate dehydrogenase (quinone) large subunit
VGSASGDFMLGMRSNSLIGKFSPPVVGYTMLRLAIGMSMLIHGLGRLPRHSAFVEETVKQFAPSPLPVWAVTAFARMTPPVETVIGLLVFLGFGTRLGLAAGGLWMVSLIFGSALIENYGIVAIQLLYSLIFCYLLQHLDQNGLSVDSLLRRDRSLIKPHV